MKTKLSYGSFEQWNSGEDMLHLTFNSKKSRLSFILGEICKGKEDRVFLLHVDRNEVSNDSIYVFKNMKELFILGVDEPNDMALHVYPTFEDAYAVALSLREGCKLCYGK